MKHLLKIPSNKATYFGFFSSSAASKSNGKPFLGGTSVCFQPLENADSFYHKDLSITVVSPSQKLPKPSSTAELGFGFHYSDHMMEVDWNESEGWSNPRINPIHEFRLHPGSRVLHYAIQQFEGLKAYRGVDNRIRIFRIDKNIERMKKTAKRICLPDFDGEELIKIICELIKIDKEWVPHSTLSSLYIRIAMIGTESNLILESSKQAKLFVLTGPVGAYYSTGFKPVTLLADPSFVRAFPGGVGEFKMGSNYAPTVMVSKMGKNLGCQQVLWLYGKDEKLTEVSSMNIFILWKKENGDIELLTPPITDGSNKRYPTLAEVRKALKEDRLIQMFGTGTAVLLSPVSEILYYNSTTKSYEKLLFPAIELDSKLNVVQRLFDTFTDIHYGRKPAPDGWIQVVE